MSIRYEQAWTFEFSSAPKQKRLIAGTTDLFPPRVYISTSIKVSREARESRPEQRGGLSRELRKQFKPALLLSTLQVW